MLSYIERQLLKYLKSSSWENRNNWFISVVNPHNFEHRLIKEIFYAPAKLLRNYYYKYAHEDALAITWLISPSMLDTKWVHSLARDNKISSRGRRH